MTLSESINGCYTKYAQFQGRASRSEYWWFFLFVVIIGELIQVAVTLVMQQPYLVIDPVTGAVFYTGAFWVTQGIGLIVITIPSVSVMVRRLHDSNKSGWWWLINLTIIGAVYFLYLLMRKGTAGVNRFGNP